MSLKVSNRYGVKTWQADFTHERQRFRIWLAPVETMTEGEAKAEYSKVYAEVVYKGAHQVKKEGKKNATFREVIEGYIGYLAIYKGERAAYECESRLRRARRFFRPQATEINQNDIEAYVRMRVKSGIAGTTINRELETIKTAYNRAIRLKQATENPFEVFDKFPDVERTRYLTKDEMGRLLAECKVHDETLITCTKMRYIYDVVSIAITTGMRLREILYLNRSEFDWSLGIIKKSGLPTQKGGRATKNRCDKVLPLPEYKDVVRLLKARYDEAGKPGRKGWLFWNPKTGKPIDRVDKAFKHCLRKAGIEDFRFHDLRHTFGTYMLLATSDLRTTGDLLGHKSQRMTQRYTHVLLEGKQAAMSKMSGVLFGEEQKKLPSDF